MNAEVITALRTQVENHDWSISPLGEQAGWPTALQAICALMLDSKAPMFLAWGADLTFLYNDAYSEMLGDKHPRALGARFEDVWAEVWPDISAAGRPGPAW